MNNNESENGISNENFERAERNNYAVKNASELADAMGYGVYPMNIMEFIWNTLKSMLDRNDMSFNNPDYAEAVLPLLAVNDPENSEVFISMTIALKKAQDEQGIIREPYQIKEWIKTAYFQSENAAAHLESEERQTVSGINELARQISEIMSNPFLPEHLRNVIADEINEADEVDDFSPATVLHNLNVIREREADDFSPAAQNNPPIPITTRRRGKTAQKKKSA